MPSAVLLGDETLERHGLLISTIAHIGDLVLWSALLSIPVAVKVRLDKKRQQN